jgi:hypothetical protein
MSTSVLTNISISVKSNGIIEKMEEILRKKLADLREKIQQSHLIGFGLWLQTVIKS